MLNGMIYTRSEVRSCTEFFANDTKIKTTGYGSTVNKEYYNVYMLGDLHPLRGKSGLGMYDLF